MNIQFIIICFLLLASANDAFGQEKTLLLEIKQIDELSMANCQPKLPNSQSFRRSPSTDRGLLMLQCELQNISSEVITVKNFLTSENFIQVELPNGKLFDFAPFICGSSHLSGSLVPEETFCWNFDINAWFFRAADSSENGTYKFYWVVNGEKSEPFIYEYNRSK